jgi:predicted permease
MRLSARIRNRLRSLFGRGRLEAEMDAEMQMHLELRTEKNIAAGMSPVEAGYAARRGFGGVEQIKENARDQRSGVWLGYFLQDLRYGVRMLFKWPVFSIVAILSLALGIGAATAIFSLVNAILLGSLPVPNPQELHVINWSSTACHMAYWGVSGSGDGRQTGEDFSYPAFLALRKQCASQAEIFAYVPTYEGVIARARHEAVIAQGLMVSGNFFSGLGIHPLIGNLLTDQDDHPGAAPKVVISYRWWQQQFNLDPDVLGQQVVLNGRNFTVVGVLPRGFTGVRTGSVITDLYFPISVQPQLAPANWRVNSQAYWWVALMARLKPGVSGAQLMAGLEVTFKGNVEKFLTQPEILLFDGRDGPDENRGQYQNVLLPLLGVVGIVLVVTCANLAGLLLARGAARQHELAIRAAVGASRTRLIRQLLTECVLLSSIGGGFGLLLAVWGRTAISRILAGSLEGLHYDTAMDRKVLGFAVLVTLLTGVLSGLYPALKAGSLNPLVGLRDRASVGLSRFRVGHVLVVAQICLSLILIVGAGLYIRTLVNLSRINPGFAIENVLLFRLNPGNAGFNPARISEYYTKVQDEIVGIPGVTSASLIPFPLLANTTDYGNFTIPNKPPKRGVEPSTHVLTVGERFFTTMGIPILAGRELRAADSIDAPKVLVVNEAFVRKYFTGENPVGQTLMFGNVDWQIVGVCADTKYVRLQQAGPEAVYFSFRQRSNGSAYFAVRTALAPMGIATAVRKAVAAVDPDIPLDDLSTQAELRDRTIGPERTMVALCGSLGVLTILLSCIGLYGLISFDVSRRMGEVGIRMALGATRWQIVEPVLRGAFFLAGAGIAIGVPAALALTRVFCTNLYGLAPSDPLTFCSAALLMLALALVSASIPAIRAARVDLMAALGCE